MEESQFEALVGHDALDLDVEVRVVQHCVHTLLDEVLQSFLVVVLLCHLHFNLLTQLWHRQLNLIRRINIVILQELEYLKPPLLAHHIRPVSPLHSARISRPPNNLIEEESGLCVECFQLVGFIIPQITFTHRIVILHRLHLFQNINNTDIFIENLHVNLDSFQILSISTHQNRLRQTILLRTDHVKAGLDWVPFLVDYAG